MQKETILEEEAAEQRRQYYREWRATHKDAVKRHNQTYWRRRAERAAAARKEAEDGNTWENDIVRD